MLARWDVVLLQETHLRPGQEAQLPLPQGYDCFGLACPDSEDMTRQQGGLLAVYKTSLAIENVTPPAETELMLLKLAGVYLINVYLPPPGSPWVPDPCRMPIQRLTELLTPLAIAELPLVLLAGDFNARIGDRHCSLPRSSPDTLPPNERGSRLLQLCEDLDFQIVSGSHFQTEHSRSRFTSFQHNGNTVIDLVVASAQLLNTSIVSFMTVHTPVDLWSDHAPLQVVLSLPSPVTARTARAVSNSPKPQPTLTRQAPLLPTQPDPVDYLLADILRTHATPRGSIQDIYGLVWAVSPPVQVWLAGTVQDGPRSSTAGAGIYFSQGSPFNQTLRVPGEPTAVRAVIFALAVLLHSSPSHTSLRVYTVNEFVIHSVCVWAPRNAASRWKVCDGDLLLAVACLIRARAAPVVFHAPSPLLPSPALHTALQLATTGAALPIPPSVPLSVPSEWPRPPNAPPPDTRHLQKVFTKLLPVKAPPRKPPAEPSYLAQEHDSLHWVDDSNCSPQLAMLRRANLRRLLASESDHTFWSTFRAFTSDKPRPAPVTVAQLCTSFRACMNPPQVLPGSFDLLRHTLNQLRVERMSSRTTDTTAGKYDAGLCEFPTPTSNSA